MATVMGTLNEIRLPGNGATARARKNGNKRRTTMEADMAADVRETIGLRWPNHWTKCSAHPFQASVFLDRKKKPRSFTSICGSFDCTPLFFFNLHLFRYSLRMPTTDQPHLTAQYVSYCFPHIFFTASLTSIYLRIRIVFFVMFAAMHMSPIIVVP